MPAFPFVTSSVIGPFKISRTICNGRIIVQSYFPSSCIKDSGMHETHPLRHEDGCGCQYTETIFHTAAEVDGRSFFKVFRRARNLANSESEHHGLRNHLVVEYKIVGVLK